MVANISPAASCVKETASTLGFAHRAKMIKNKVGASEHAAHLERVGTFAQCVIDSTALERSLQCLLAVLVKFAVIQQRSA